MVMSTIDWRDAVRAQLRLALGWLSDLDAPLPLRRYARQAAAAALHHLPDEQAVTDALTVLHRAVDRGDLVALELVEDMPSFLADGRYAEEAALLPLGARALARGAVEALLRITRVSLETPCVHVPADGIGASVEAATSDDPRREVYETVGEWLQQNGNDPAPIADALQRRPAIVESLRNPPEIPF
jgi:hypothetical protein